MAEDDRERHARTPADPIAPIIFGLLEMIERGDADRWLLRLRGAIEARRRTEAYVGYIDHIVVGEGAC